MEAVQLRAHKLHAAEDKLPAGLDCVRQLENVAATLAQSAMRMGLLWQLLRQLLLPVLLLFLLEAPSRSLCLCVVSEQKAPFVSWRKSSRPIDFQLDYHLPAGRRAIALRSARSL